MQRKTLFLYISAWAIYAPVAFIIFPLTNNNVLFPVIPLLFAGSWLFGRTGGFIAALGTLFFYIAINEFYADIYAYYGDRLIAPLMMLTIIFYAGTLKENLAGMAVLNRKLDRLVTERNTELQSLTAKLLEKTEAQKVAHGQELHDGMGQYITGIQLLCSSLANQLAEEKHESAFLAESLCTKTASVHHQIRRISRMHFPIRIGEVGFIPALNELSSSVQDIKPIRFIVEERRAVESLKGKKSLQLYRICQEASLHAIDQLGANIITIQVDESETAISVGINHNGCDYPVSGAAIQKLIRYRLNMLSGSISKEKSIDGLDSTRILIPKTASF